MAARIQTSESSKRKIHAYVFAALGDETRLALINKLSRHSPQSISELTQDSHLSRQAVTRHLEVLQRAGLVRSLYKGRHTFFEFTPDSMIKMSNYLHLTLTQWNNEQGPSL